MYESIRDVLAKYRSGKLPKAFKIVSNLANWEHILYITDPPRWSAAVIYQATRIFASNLKEKMARDYINIKNSAGNIRQIITPIVDPTIPRTNSIFGIKIPMIKEILTIAIVRHRNLDSDIHTRRNKREFKLARHGKITKGKLNATENTNPILINSDVMLGSKLNKIFPVM